MANTGATRQARYLAKREIERLRNEVELLKFQQENERLHKQLAALRSKTKTKREKTNVGSFSSGVKHRGTRKIR
jgi:hypothetical protein